MGPNEFLSVIREQLNYRPGQVSAGSEHWNPEQELHRQCVDTSTEMEVHPDHLKLTTARQHLDRAVIAIVKARSRYLNPRQSDEAAEAMLRDAEEDDYTGSWTDCCQRGAEAAGWYVVRRGGHTADNGTDL